MESKPCVTILRISPQQHTRHPMTFTEVHCLVSPLKHLSFKPPGEQLTDPSFHQKTESCSIYEMSFQLLLVCCIPHCEWRVCQFQVVVYTLILCFHTDSTITWYLRIKSTTKCSYEVFCAAAISVAVTTFLLFTAPRNTKCPWETGDSKCCDNTLLYKWELHKSSLQDLHTINVLVYTSVANAILGPFQHVLFLSLTQASNTSSNGTKKKQIIMITIHHITKLLLICRIQKQWNVK